MYLQQLSEQLGKLWKGIIVMAKKTITARTYVGGTPMAKVTWETNDGSELGKKFVRLTVDEITSWMRTVIVPVGVSWAVTYTDGYEELSFGADDTDADVEVKIDGESVGTTNNITTTMWDWLETKGWY